MKTVKVICRDEDDDYVIQVDGVEIFNDRMLAEDAIRAVVKALGAKYEDAWSHE